MQQFLLCSESDFLKAAVQNEWPFFDCSDAAALRGRSNHAGVQEAPLRALARAFIFAQIFDCLLETVFLRTCLTAN